jgi:hypothetical protein
MNHRQKLLPVLLLCLMAPGVRADDAKTLEQQAAEMQQLSTPNPARAEKGVAEDFVTLAGSADNADRLVSGLRSGSNVDLVWTDATGKELTTTIDPATGKQGLGSVFISLALAQESLAQAGITKPTPEELNAALNGGTVTVDGKTVELQGVLAQRAAGAGWGKIAQSLGVKLGHVVSAIKSENGRLRAAERSRRELARAERQRKQEGERGPKSERAGGPDRPDRPAHPERPARPDRAR